MSQDVAIQRAKRAGGGLGLVVALLRAGRGRAAAEAHEPQRGDLYTTNGNKPTTDSLWTAQPGSRVRLLSLAPDGEWVCELVDPVKPVPGVRGGQTIPVGQDFEIAFGLHELDLVWPVAAGAREDGRP